MQAKQWGGIQWVAHMPKAYWFRAKDGEKRMRCWGVKWQIHVCTSWGLSQEQHWVLLNKSSVFRFCFCCGLVLCIYDGCWKRLGMGMCVLHQCVCVLNLRPTNMGATSLLWNLLLWKCNMMLLLMQNLFNLYIYIYSYFFFPFIWYSLKIFLFQWKNSNP